MPLTVFVPVTGHKSADPSSADGRFVVVTGDRIVIGRGASADVRLPDASVAPRHATVRADGGRWILQDERSRNGTAVREPDGAVRLLEANLPTRVEDGAWIRIGRVWIRVYLQHAPSGVECRTAKDLAAALVALGLEALDRPHVAEVRFVDGPTPIDGFALAEDSFPYVLGRGDTSAVVIDDPEVSRVQCTIVRRGSLVHIKAQGGVTFLGERELPLGENVLWNPKELLQIGRSLFGLADPVSATLAAIEADAEVGVPAELLPPCPEDDPSAVTPPPLAVHEDIADELFSGPLGSERRTAKEPSIPLPLPLPAPAQVRRPPRALLSRAEFTVVLLAAFVLFASLIALNFVLKKP